MNELAEIHEVICDKAINIGRYYVSEKKTYDQPINLECYYFENANAILNLYKAFLSSIINFDYPTDVVTGSSHSLNEALTGYSSIIEIINSKGGFLTINKESKIFSDYISILENESSEHALVYLYTSLISLLDDIKSCDLFLECIKVDLLSVDAIVHILNALSPNKTKLKNWISFVEKCEKKLIELEGPDNAKDLLSVIL
ncbi:MAG: hypothetical protein ABSF81_14820 [Bacteroidales bacterium]|jgi:hypothetical protein